MAYVKKYVTRFPLDAHGILSKLRALVRDDSNVSLNNTLLREIDRLAVEIDGHSGWLPDWDIKSLFAFNNQTLQASWLRTSLYASDNSDSGRRKAHPRRVDGCVGR